MTRPELIKEWVDKVLAAKPDHYFEQYFWANKYIPNRQFCNVVLQELRELWKNKKR